MLYFPVLELKIIKKSSENKVILSGCQFKVKVKFVNPTVLQSDTNLAVTNRVGLTRLDCTHGLSPQTVKGYRACLGSVLNWQCTRPSLI